MYFEEVRAIKEYVLRGSTLTFHGDSDDLALLFLDWFGSGELVLCETLSALNQEPVCGHTPDFAVSRLVTLGAMSSPPMVIAPFDRSLSFERVAMRDGSGSKQQIGLDNRFVVGIRLGGQTADMVLQPTVVTTSGDDVSAAAMFKRLKKSVTKRSRRVRDCWVLPGAYEKLQLGWRLPGGQFQAACTDLPTQPQ